MAAARRKKPMFEIKVDERVEGITFEALECRESNHSWQRQPLSSARKLELLRQAETETVRICSRCAARRIEVYSLPNFETISYRIEYPDGYLMDPRYKGTGRLPKNEARKARIISEIPELAMVN